MRLGAVMAVAALALSLSGCATTPPPGPSDEQIAALEKHALEQTWALTGLPGDAPVVAARPALANDVWPEALHTCMQEEGFQLESFGYSSDTGAELSTNSGDAVDDPDMQRAFYRCIAANPLALDKRDLALTDDQLDYIYDYYRTSLVPCMIINGFTPTTAPSRVEFRALAGQWSPYYSVDVGISSVQYEQIERICGPERPELY